MVTTLFTAYKTCEDSTFVKFVTRKEEDYEEGTLRLNNADMLMTMALEKYKTIVQKGTWLKKSNIKLEFISLLSNVKFLKQNPKKQVAAEPKAAQSGTTAKEKSCNSGKFAWKDVTPKAGESNAKQFNGKEYIYCPHHKGTLWVLKTTQQGLLHSSVCSKMMVPVAAPMTLTAGAINEAKIEAVVSHLAVNEEI